MADHDHDHDEALLRRLSDMIDAMEDFQAELKARLGLRRELDKRTGPPCPKGNRRRLH